MGVKLGFHIKERTRTESGQKGLETTGSWRKLHNQELHKFCTSQNIIIIASRRMRWTRHAAYVGEKKNAYRILVGKPEGKRKCHKTYT
jgi:hypothetical protein